MVKKVKAKKKQESIYFEQDVLDYVQACMVTSDRGISQEVNHMIKRLREYRDKNDLQAITMAGQCNPPQS